jgi:hypothetical protein
MAGRPVLPVEGLPGKTHRFQQCLIQIRAAGFAGPKLEGMTPILYRCPRTGMNVQWRFEHDPPADEKSQRLTSVMCPACGLVHFIGTRTGKLSGDK